jgi:hypothetical protein
MAGRKPVVIPTLVFWEQHWWRTLSLMRDGSPGGEEVEVGWFPPQDFGEPIRPDWMTHPGVIHDWNRKVRDQYYSRFDHKTYTTEAIKPECHLWEALKRARTARRVRWICAQSKWRSRLSMLYEHAEKFICALNEDDRYPRKASTKDDQRLLYCARVMAGISCRIPPGTAVDKLRKLKYGKVRSCDCTDCTSIKKELVQWMLVDLHNGTVSRPRAMLARVDNHCNCSHCVLVAHVARKER